MTNLCVEDSPSIQTVARWNAEGVATLQKGNVIASKESLQRSLEELRKIKRTTMVGTASSASGTHSYNVESIVLGQRLINPAKTIEITHGGSSFFTLWNRAFLFESSLVNNATTSSSNNFTEVTSIILYNIAMCHFISGMIRNRSSQLKVALKAFSMAANTLLQDQENCVSSGKLHVFTLALISNTGLLYEYFMDHGQASKCLQPLQRWFDNPSVDDCFQLGDSDVRELYERVIVSSAWIVKPAPSA